MKRAFLYLAFFCAFSCLCLRTDIQYMEHWQTMFFNRFFVSDTVFNIGGLANILGLCIVQFFCKPWIGCILLSVLLAAISELEFRMLSSFHKNDHPLFAYLAVAPAVLLAFQTPNVNYYLAGTVAFLCFQIVCLSVESLPGKIRPYAHSLAAVTSFLLFGPVASLYCIHLIYNIFRQRNFVYLVPLAVIIGLSLPYPLFHLSPAGYYHRDVTVSFSAFLPWIAHIALFILIFIPIRNLKFITHSLGIVALSGVVIVSFFSNEKKQGLRFKLYSCLANNGNWPAIIDDAVENRLDNALLLNYANLASAKTNRMSTLHKLFRSGDIVSMFVATNKTPYVSAMISDVYYHVGLIAMSQRYAFEANENCNNFSPRLLQRLTDISIIMGQYAVAEKYINILESTLFYADWASSRRIFLYDDNAVLADKELGILRRSLFEDNHFVAINGLKNDIELVVKACPDNKIAQQYLEQL